MKVVKAKEVTASYNTKLSPICNINKQMDQLWLFMAPSESVMDLFKQQTLKEPKLAQLDMMLYKLFTAMCCKGKPAMKPTTKKAMSSYGEMKITDKCTFCESTNKKNFCKNLHQHRYCLIIQNI
jgi:hypothetical protein